MNVQVKSENQEKNTCRYLWIKQWMWFFFLTLSSYGVSPFTIYSSSSALPLFSVLWPSCKALQEKETKYGSAVVSQFQREIYYWQSPACARLLLSYKKISKIKGKKIIWIILVLWLSHLAILWLYISKINSVILWNYVKLIQHFILNLKDQTLTN